MEEPISGDLTGLVAGLVGGLCVEAGGAAEFEYGSCLAQVEDGVEDQSAAAGYPLAAVTGLCYEASQSDDFAGACAYYGAAGALTATCLQLGFDAETCAAAAEQAINIKHGLDFFNTFLNVFAGLAIFVGAFIIQNTFRILIFQRTKELALLRALGTSRRQVYRLVLSESLFMSIIGSALGIGLGIGLAVLVKEGLNLSLIHI